MVPANPPQPESHPMLPALISPAYAQDAGSMMASVTQFAPLILIFVVFYFILIRPQQQRQKELKRALGGLRRGDRVVTAGGIIGTVQRVREGSNEVEVEIAPNVRVTVIRDTISSVISPQAANDAKPPAKASAS
jgi:preprotein translocase subunit YajC